MLARRHELHLLFLFFPALPQIPVFAAQDIFGTRTRIRNLVTFDYEQCNAVAKHCEIVLPLASIFFIGLRNFRGIGQFVCVELEVVCALIGPFAQLGRGGCGN